jgi:DNA-binding CsgD family transcriptional regulator
MRVVPDNGSPSGQGERPWEAEPAAHQPGDGPGRIDAMRSWLVSGVHVFVVDPRRRFGDHARAKELLVGDSREQPGPSDHWHRLATALQRHNLRGGLAQLSSEERHLVTLAYLDGLSNSQIAAKIGVSVSTVQRRLAAALERLETYISRSGAWLSAVILFVAGYAALRAARLGRWAAGIVDTPEHVQKVAATLAAGAFATAAFGMVALTSDSAVPKPKASAPSHVMAQAADSSNAPVEYNPGTTPVVVLADEPEVSSGGEPQVRPQETTEGGVLHHNKGCHGNPTSAPPPVPVGSKDDHPKGAPVTHPSAGGCRA